MMLLGGQTTEIHMYKHLPFLHVSLAIDNSHSIIYGLASQTSQWESGCARLPFAHCIVATALDSAFRLFANLASHSSQRLARRIIVRIEGRLGRVLSHCSLLSHNLQGVTCTLAWGACVGVRQFIGATWRRQASHGWGEKWFRWNRTNRTGGYGPDYIHDPNYWIAHWFHEERASNYNVQCSHIYSKWCNLCISWCDTAVKRKQTCPVQLWLLYRAVRKRSSAFLWIWYAPSHTPTDTSSLL